MESFYIFKINECGEQQFLKSVNALTVSFSLCIECKLLLFATGKIAIQAFLGFKKGYAFK